MATAVASSLSGRACPGGVVAWVTGCAGADGPPEVAGAPAQATNCVASTHQNKARNRDGIGELRGNSKGSPRVAGPQSNACRYLTGLPINGGTDRRHPAADAAGVPALHSRAADGRSSDNR